MAKAGRLRSGLINERYSQLAEIKEGELEALLQQLRLGVGEGKGRERWVALGLNLLAGIIIIRFGVLAGPWLRKVLGIGG